MAIQAKAYGNRKAEVSKDGEKIPNRVSLMMTMEEAELLVNKDRATVAAIIEAANQAINGSDEE